MKKSRVLIIFIVLGIIASSILLVNRVSMEAKDKTVDIILDLDEIEKMVKQSDEDLDWWLRNFKKWGVRSVALVEENFESLANKKDPMDIQILGNLRKEIGWEEDYPKEFVQYIEDNELNEYDVVVRTKSTSLYNFIDKGLNSRYDKKRYQVFQAEDQYLFLLHGTEKEALFNSRITLLDINKKPYSLKEEVKSSKLLKLGLGYDEDKIDIIKNAGLEVSLRPSNYNLDWQEDVKYIEAVLEDYEKYDIKPEYMIFTGEQALGYPGNSDIVLDFMKDNNTKLALIESGVQRGHLKQEATEEYGRLLDYNSVRLFSMPAYIQERYKHYNYSGAEEIENTLYRAITERNIRLIYFRPFKDSSHSYVTDEAEYEKTFINLESRLDGHKIKIGPSSTMGPKEVSSILTFFIGLAILAGGMILLGSIFKLSLKFRKIIFILGIIFVPAIIYIAPYTSKTIFAIIAAIIFPTLSMVYCCTQLKKYFNRKDIKKPLKFSIMKGIQILLISSAISFIASIFVASLLSSTEYLLEIKVFRGVKIVQMLPIILYVFIFLGLFGYKSNKNSLENKLSISDLKELMLDNIQIVTMISGALLLAVGYIYLARTGHETDVQPSDYEMIARNFLEMKLLARPRTKEFLIAFPAVLLAIYMALKNNKVGVFILGLFIVIGQTSIVNTFSHLRTPMYLSVIRNVYGIAFGIIIGILYLIIIHGGFAIYNSLKGEIFDE